MRPSHIIAELCIIRTYNLPIECLEVTAQQRTGKPHVLGFLGISTLFPFYKYGNKAKEGRMTFTVIRGMSTGKKQNAPDELAL